jgi:pyruvate/2-oxoglutarate dehydrogenase complex dihydrolipoamide acyltransferase (E2) component
MHATKDKPWVVDGQVVVRPIMVVALTYDHRLLDGREGELLSQCFPFPWAPLPELALCCAMS